MAKIVTLKNNNDEDVYPITTAEAVNGGLYADNGIEVTGVIPDVTTSRIVDGAVTSGKIDWTTIPQGATGLTQQNFKGYFDIGNIRVQYMNLRQTGLNTGQYGYNAWTATWPAPFGNNWYCAVANATSDTGNVAGNDLKVVGRTTTDVQINYNHITAIGGSEVYYSVIGIGLKPS